MALQDKVISCRECGDEFTFSVGEQEFYASKGFANTPVRCKPCRTVRRSEARKYENSQNPSYNGGPEVSTVTCAECGKPAEVPFKPKGDRPVYCNDCYRARR